MDDFRCPHCRNGSLVEGTCVACGWSITAAAHLRPLRPPIEPSPAAVPACWFLLPLASAFVNVFVPVVSIAVDDELGGLMTTGIAAAQFGLLAIIAAFGPGRNAVRLPVTFVVAIGLLFMLMVGVAAGIGIAPAGRPLREAAGYFLVLPALLLAAQSPLWLFRAVTGRQMSRPTVSAERNPPDKTQFGVAQMMWATALIAVCMALARGAFALWNPGRGDALGQAWGNGAFVCAQVAVGSTFVALPSTAVLMAKAAGGAAVLVLVYAAIVTIASLGIVNAVAAPGRPVTADVAAALALLSFMTFGGILAGLGVLRSSGYSMLQE